MSLYDGQPDPQTPFLPEADTVQQGNFLMDAMAAGGQGYVASQGEVARSNQLPYKSITTTFDPQGNPVHDIKGVSQAYMDHIQKQVRFASQAQSMLSQVADAAQRKAAVLEQHPLLAAIGKISSSVASQYAAPGSRGQAIVRGLGAFGADFFQDSPEQLLMRAASAQKESFGIENTLVNQYEDIRRQNIAEARAQRQDTISEEQLKIARDRQQANAVDDFMRVYEQNAGKGADMEKAFRAVASTRKDLFKSDAEIEQRALGLRYTAQARRDELQREAAAKLADRMLTIREGKLNRAATLAAGRMDAQSRMYAQNVGTIDSKIADLARSGQNAQTFFGTLAAQMGMPPPKTEEDAKKVLTAVLGQKGQTLPARIREDAFLNGYKQAGLLDAGPQIEQMKRQRAAYISKVSPDMRGIIDTPPSPIEVLTNPDPQNPKGRVIAPEIMGLLSSWAQTVGDSPATRARAAQMLQEIQSGQMPREILPVDKGIAKDAMSPFESWWNAPGIELRNPKKKENQPTGSDAYDTFWESIFPLPPLETEQPRKGSLLNRPTSLRRAR